MRTLTPIVRLACYSESGWPGEFLQAGRPVDQLAEQVGVTVVPGVLVDHQAIMVAARTLGEDSYRDAELLR